MHPVRDDMRFAVRDARVVHDRAQYCLDDAVHARA